MAHDILDIKTVHPTKGYSHAARAGNLLFIAGQVAKDRDDKLVGLGDVAAQARQIYRNLGAVLGEAGGSLSDIVKMTTYLTHSGYVETYRTVRNEFFTDPMPPNTLVICESLATPEFLMEVEATAVLGSRR
ncbi:MAG TPA: RidA family protein [Gammaproteobacteria bacterium]|nr:RidA family protein [Gammaproteobacteria bacterium]